MSDKIKIYVASPLGFSESGREFMCSSIIPIFEKLGYEVLDPFKLAPVDTIKLINKLPYGQERKDKFKEINLVIGEINVEAIKESSAIFAVLDGADVDSGTASEIGFAAALKKPILGYRSDFRLSADNEGSIVNLQVEYFIKLNGGKIITTIDSVEDEIQHLLK